MRKPFNGAFPITQVFGEKITDPAGHTGIDYALYLGTPVLAAQDGEVTRIGYLKTGYGTHVILRHEDGLVTVYAHLSSVQVKTGMLVKAGDTLGLSGNTGNSTGPHLHFEVRRGGIPVDPELYLDHESAKAEGTHAVCVPELYVRSGPGTEYPIVDSLKRGAQVTPEDQLETVWMRIGENRWVASRYQGRNFCESVA